MELVNATIADLNALRELEKTCFPKDAWGLLDLIAVLTVPGLVRIKVVENGQMIGFLAGESRHHEATAWVATICVHPDHQRRGIGRQLLEAGEARFTLPNIRLCVRAGNTPAINLYHKAGYRLVDTWWRYYFDGEDAIVMEKRVRQPSYQPFGL